jgi:hypothetical protein
MFYEEGWGAFYMGRPRVQGRHKFRTHSELGRGMLLDQVTLLSFALSLVVFQPFVFVLSWIRDKRFSLFLVERFTQFSNLHFSFCYAMVSIKRCSNVSAVDLATCEGKALATSPYWKLTHVPKPLCQPLSKFRELPHIEGDPRRGGPSFNGYLEFDQKYNGSWILWEA